MFVTICTYRARAGDEDAIIALHEDWQRRLRPKATGYLSGELLHDAQDPQVFLAIARYESQAAARAIARDPEQVVWQRRLVSLTEAEPIYASYQSTWQAD
jgi:quinol monooxygenase YgiN